jgi:hypothetical protein
VAASVGREHTNVAGSGDSNSNCRFSPCAARRAPREQVGSPGEPGHRLGGGGAGKGTNGIVRRDSEGGDQKRRRRGRSEEEEGARRRLAGYLQAGVGEPEDDKAQWIWEAALTGWHVCSFGACTTKQPNQATPPCITA